MLSILTTLHLAVAVPDGDPSLPAGVSEFFSQVIGWAKGGVLALGVIGMIACGAMMIIGRRNRSATAVDGAAGIPWVLGGLFLASTAATLVGAVVG
jgi:type IV secretory pathway VirB2 component (pilin)